MDKNGPFVFLRGFHHPGETLPQKNRGETTMTLHHQGSKGSHHWKYGAKLSYKNHSSAAVVNHWGCIISTWKRSKQTAWQQQQHICIITYICIYICIWH